MDILKSIVLAIEPDHKKAGLNLLYLHFIGMLSMPILAAGFVLLRIPMLISFAPLYVYHLMYRKCPVTSVERRLHAEDRTVIDIFLYTFGIPPNKKSRDTALLILSSTFMAFIVYISIIST